MQEGVFLDGLMLMGCGMGVVIGFLIVMIISMTIMSKILKPFAAKFEIAPAAPAKKAPAASGNDSQLAAVAAAAVELFRNSK